jgi:hypothetical protein
VNSWQTATLSQLRNAMPDATVTPYGSVLTPDLVDGWSDLDVEVQARREFDVEDVLAAPVWAFQEATDVGSQVIRAVLRDGRRVDLKVSGATGVLPTPAADNDIRFDAALAAAKFGRGSDLIGLHLSLGILREALVQSMVSADDATGTVHHRSRTGYDDRASKASAVVAGPLGPGTARASYELYGRWRAENEPDYAPDLTGLDAVMARAEWVPRDAHDAIRAELDADTDEYRDAVPAGEWTKPNRR